MTNVLILGARSYIGDCFAKYYAAKGGSSDVLDMKSDSWKDRDFSPYGAVLCVVGIAHTKETLQNRDLYYKVQRDLVFEAAQKAKSEGVPHFIFLSSMSVYGLTCGKITIDTIPIPNSAYGQSKLEAEQLLFSEGDDAFTVSVLRPPMVYGKDCRGNYPRLARLVKKLPAFPLVKNERSMIYIDNLCELLSIIISDKKGGLFFPQDEKYTATSEMARIIAAAHGKKLFVTRLLAPAAWLIRCISASGKKVFGSLTYDMSMSAHKPNYRIVSSEHAIFISEGVYE